MFSCKDLILRKCCFFAILMFLTQLEFCTICSLREIALPVFSLPCRPSPWRLDRIKDSYNGFLNVDDKEVYYRAELPQLQGGVVSCNPLYRSGS